MNIITLFLDGLLIGLIIGIIGGIIFYLKTKKSNIPSWDSAWKLCIRNISSNGITCKKHYDNWYKEYQTKNL